MLSRNIRFKIPHQTHNTYRDEGLQVVNNLKTTDSRGDLEESDKKEIEIRSIEIIQEPYVNNNEVKKVDTEV